jgi:hypothetical protein
VLPDRDRLTLAGALQDARALPLRRSWIARERRAFRNLVRSAQRKLVISFARLDPGTGAARLASTLVVELAEEREGRALDFAALDRLDWVERVPLRRSEPPSGGPLLSREEYDLLALARLAAAARRRYVRRLGGFAARGLLLDSLRNGRARFTVCDGWLGTEESRARLAQEFSARIWSASQLATYATCPFRFFMRHALRLEPLDRDPHRDLSALEVGRLVHRVLELFYRRQVERDPASMREVGFEALRGELHDALEQVCGELESRGAQGSPVLWEIRKRHLHEDLGSRRNSSSDSAPAAARLSRSHVGTARRCGSVASSIASTAIRITMLYASSTTRAGARRRADARRKRCSSFSTCLQRFRGTRRASNAAKRASST